jgi:hypothetical protein
VGTRPVLREASSSSSSTSCQVGFPAGAGNKRPDKSYRYDIAADVEPAACSFRLKSAIPIDLIETLEPGDRQGCDGLAIWFYTDD